MSEELEVYVLEAVANAAERLEEIHIDWLVEGGPGALEGDTLLLAVTQGQLTDDWYGGEFVSKEDYDAIAAQRDERLAREAELRKVLRLSDENQIRQGLRNNNLREEVSTLQQRLAEAEKDAARYRFLRDGERGGLEYWDEQACVCSCEDTLFGEALDFTVDEAIDEMAERIARAGCADGETAA